MVLLQIDVPFHFLEGLFFSFKYFFVLETVYDSLCVLDMILL